jgi:hypothetical protein
MAARLSVRLNALSVPLALTPWMSVVPIVAVNCSTDQRGSGSS